MVHWPSKLVEVVQHGIGQSLALSHSKRSLYRSRHRFYVNRKYNGTDLIRIPATERVECYEAAHEVDESKRT